MGLNEVGGGLRTGGLQEFSMTGELITWKTASDWDNAVDENGVVHENDANRDLPGATTVQQGYPSYDEGGSSLIAFYPLDEDSGPTAYDVAGNYNGSVNGATIEQTGLHNSTAYSFGGTSDNVQISNDGGLAGHSELTVVTWVHLTNLINDRQRFASIWDGGTNSHQLFVWNTDHNSTPEFELADNGYINQNGSHSLSTGEWIMVAGTISSSAHRVYKNDQIAAEDTSPSGGDVVSSTDDLYLGNDSSLDSEMKGRLENVRIYSRELAPSEITDLYNAGTSGYLKTATQSFSAPVSPDLQNLSYSLNSQGITLDVIGSPGTTDEEIVSQTLDGSSSYTLSWTNSHTDFRVQSNLTSHDLETSPTLSRIGLSGLP